MNQKNQKRLENSNVVLVVIIVFLVGAVGYFAFLKKSEPATEPPTPSSTTNTQTGTYQNEQYGFSFQHPKEWNVIETTRERMDEPVKRYSLFEAENVDLSGDRGRFLVDLSVFTKQNNSTVIISEGFHDHLVYQFAENNFFSSPHSGSEKYTWETIKSSSDISEVLYTPNGTQVLKGLVLSPSPDHFIDTYFMANSDRTLALLFEFDYFGEDQALWIRRGNRDNLSLMEEKRVVETRAMLESVIKSLVFKGV